jgi:hypothetical protein
MRNMSFALTTQQVRDQSKNVTRRLGWLHLKAGDEFQPVMKCMGLRPGEKIERIGGSVLTVSTCREPLSCMTDDQDYGREECRREGFPHLSPAEFVQMFCASHKGCTPDSLVTRIEFYYEVPA